MQVHITYVIGATGMFIMEISMIGRMYAAKAGATTEVQLR